MRLFWTINLFLPEKAKKNKKSGSQAMITSGPMLDPHPPSLSVPPLKHNTQTQSMQANTQSRTIMPTLPARSAVEKREMLSNSAFQHSTSDYLFSFPGRFELVMYFPFRAFRPLSFAPGIPRSPALDIHSDTESEVKPLFKIFLTHLPTPTP